MKKKENMVKTAKKSPEPLIQFVVKNVKGQRRKVGVIVARLEEFEGVGKMVHKVRLGWSRANFSKGDVFDKHEALKIAIGRTKAFEMVPVCHSFRKDMALFRERCLRYFKGVNLVDPVVVADQHHQSPMPIRNNQ